MTGKEGETFSDGFGLKWKFVQILFICFLEEEKMDDPKYFLLQDHKRMTKKYYFHHIFIFFGNKKRKFKTIFSVFFSHFPFSFFQMITNYV